MDKLTQDKFEGRHVCRTGKRCPRSAASVLFMILTIAAFAGTALAQGSRKDDVVFNAQGRPLAGAGVRVCTSAATGQPCAPLAQIYSDPTLTQALANPTTTDGMGNYNFYAAPGRYEIEISGLGITTKQIPNVILPSDPSTPTFTTVTTTSGISAFSLSLTGNLTVNGSTAVVGSLTVGGAPVPSTSADNQWTAGQRFKGSIPWRDFTAYMPVGGCSSTNLTDPDTTGTINSGSFSLVLTSSMDFKNGCGITVLHAGPTSSLVMPFSCSGSASRTSNVVTFTCSGNHNLGTGNVDGSGLYDGATISGCSDGTFNGVTAGIRSTADTTHFTYNQTAANSTATGCTARFILSWAHGVTGATTWYYKLAACDSGGGCSAAAGPTTITTGNATLSTRNYNWIGWPMISNTSGAAWFVCVYQSTNNVTYTLIGSSYALGFTDRGLTFPSNPNCPATPPASQTAQQLTTTITSGAGTTSLTLAASASNTATSQNVYHDETSFLTSCVNDVNTFQSTIYQGEHGCLIPAGTWHFNSMMPTNAPGSNGTKIYVDGATNFLVWPWMIGPSLVAIQGQGFSGGGLQNQHMSGAALYTGANVSAAFVIHGSAAIIKNITATSLRGHGIWITPPPNTNHGGSGFDIEQVALGEAGGSTGGVPIVFDNNVLFGTMKDDILIPNSSGMPTSILFTGSGYNGDGACCMEISNLFTNHHGILMEAPGGMTNSVGGLTEINGWQSESASDPFLTIDSGNVGGTPGAGTPAYNGTSPLVVRGLQNSDATGTANIFMYLIGQGGSSPASVVLDSSSQFAPLFACAPQGNPTVSCAASPAIVVDTPQGAGGLGSSPFVGPIAASTSPTYLLQMPLKTSMNSALAGKNPSLPAWADLLPPPPQVTVTSTGAGSLGAQQWCVVFVAVDVTGGLSLPSPEQCTTTRASASITYQVQLVTQVNGGSNLAGLEYSDFRIYYGSTPGGEANYLDTTIAPSNNGRVNYTFTSTTGNGSGLPPQEPQAYISWINRDYGANACFYCYPSAGNGFGALGIGEPSPDAGVKLAVKGGTIQGEGGIQAGSDTAFNSSPRGSYNGFITNLTSAAATYQRMTLDKAITVTRLQMVLGTAGSGCTTQAVVAATDGTTPINLTTVNRTAIYDSGAITQNYAAAANLDLKITTAASGCTTAPQNANLSVQYRMQ